MSSSEIPEIPPRKGVATRGRPLRRQPTGLHVPTVPSGSRPKRTTASRKLHKDRSMRIPAIENDMMNRIGISKKRKAMARAATKASRSSSPYKSMLAGIARTEDDLHTTSDAESSSDSESSSHPVRCASPSPMTDSPSSPSRTRSVSPQPSKQPAPPATGAAETKGKKKRIMPQSSVVLRPLPSRVAASSPHRAGGSPVVHPLSRTPPDASTGPKTRPGGTRSSGASSSPRSGSSSRRRSTRARPDDSPPNEKSHSVPGSKATVSDKYTAQPTKLQGKRASAVQPTPCVNSGEESDSQSDDLSTSDATSHEIERGRSNDRDVSAANVAQATAIKRSLLSQIEERNDGKKWDDLLGFFHTLAPTEISGLLKTATRAGRRALRKLAGKENSDNSHEDDARAPEGVRQPRRQGKSVLAFDDAGSDGEGEVMSQTTVPSRRGQFLFKAKGRARTRSPSPPLPSPPSPVFVFQTGASASSSRASNCLSVSTARKRSRKSESASDEDDEDDEEPPMKKRKARPLQREGAFYEYPAPPMPSQQGHQNDDDDDDDVEPQTVYVNLVKTFLDQVQGLDVSSWLPRGPFVACDKKVDDDDELFERGSWMPRSKLEPQGGARRRRRRGRGVLANDERKALDGAMRRTSPSVVSRT